MNILNKQTGMKTLYLIGILSTLLLSNTASALEQYTLNCIGQLGSDANADGMTVKYESAINKATVHFIKKENATSANTGECVIDGLPWNSTTIGKFCQFNVDDVIYTRNATSMNFLSVKAPYLLQILKTGGAFSLNVHSDNALCQYGYVVDNVISSN
jgi:hypothetical protein